jgi:glycerol uptake facilitator protein
MDALRTPQRLAAEVLGTAYGFGHISGNHINPAVTLALALTRQFPWRQVPAYLAAQLVGAVLGALAIIGVLGDKASAVGLGVAAYGSGVGAGQAFVAEFVGTFILVLTVLLVVHRNAAPGFAGVAIGLVVFAAIIPVAPATGAAINPARVLGPMLVQQLWGGHVSWSQAPVYLAAEFLAGTAAAVAAWAVTRTVAARTVTAVPAPAETAA